MPYMVLKGSGATRDAKLWPFHGDSAINRPIGSDATFTDYAMLRDAAYPPGMNMSSWSIPVAINNPGDPLVTVTQETQCNSGGSFAGFVAGRIPEGMTGANPQTCYRDGFLVAIDDDEMAQGFTRFQRRTSTTAVASYHGSHGQIWHHIKLGTGYKPPPNAWPGGGTWISGFSLLAGLIRSWEVAEVMAGTRLFFPHALMVTLQYELIRTKTGGLQATTITWPATWSDGNGGAYSGGPAAPRMGELLAIPATFNIEATTWSIGAKALARTLQKYGCYVMGQSDGGLKFYFEPGSQSIAISQEDLNAVRDQVRIVSNNSELTVGGGGIYPPELYPLPPFA